MLNSSERLLGVLSPIFITLLLSFVSGIPLLEKQAMQRFGHNPAYRTYRSETPVLIPFVNFPRIWKNKSPCLLVFPFVDQRKKRDESPPSIDDRAAIASCSLSSTFSQWKVTSSLEIVSAAREAKLSDTVAVFSKFESISLRIYQWEERHLRHYSR